MATPVSPDTDAILKRLEGRGGLGTPAGMPVSPQANAILSSLEQRGAPAPPPAPAPVAQPHPKDFYVQPNPSGAPDVAQASAAGAPGFFNNPVMHGLGEGKDLIFRVLAYAANPTNAYVNDVAKHGYEGGLGPALKSMFTSAPIEAGKAAISPETVPFDVFSQPAATAGRQVSPTERYVRAGADILGGTVLDALVSRGMHPVIKGATSLLGKAGTISGALDAVIPGVGRSLNQLKQGAALTKEAQQTFAAAEGKAGQIAAEGRKAIEGARQEYAKLSRLGVNLVGNTAGRRVNALDEIVSGWIEAGTPGARFASRNDALRAADALSTDPAVQQAIRTSVVKIGTDYSNAWQRVGQSLEQVGYLKPGTVQAMGGRYAARMYQATSHNPADIEAWLESANQVGGISPSAVDHAEQLLGRAAAGGQAGFSNASKERQLGTYAERVAAGAEEQATPVFAKSIQSQTKAAGRLHALADLAANPQLASDVNQPGFIRVVGSKFGPLEGKYVPQPVMRFLQTTINPDVINNPALRTLNKVSNLIKRNVSLLNLPMLEHKLKFDHVLAEGAAAAEGLGFTPADVIRAAKIRGGWLKSGNAPQSIQALMDNTRAFVPEASDFGEIGQSLRNTVGIETGGQKIVDTWRKVEGQTRNGINALAQIYKIALTEKLAPKLGYVKAAQIAQDTLGDFKNTPALIQTVERYGGIPFVTSRAKALPRMISIAVNNPDILLRYSGYRVAQGLAKAAGLETQARQQALGEPTAIPIPGMRDKSGQQQFLLHNPLSLNPVQDIQNLGAGIGGALSAGLGAAFNVDLSRGFKTGKFSPIVQPGSLPPIDALKERLRYLQEHAGPGIFTRNVPRLQNAMEGTTRYSSPYMEPETVGQALLGVLTGAQVKPFETPQERQMRASRNIQKNIPDLSYGAQYLGQLLSGAVKPETHPGAGAIHTAQDAAIQAKAAYKRLQALESGNEFKGEEKRARIKRQVEWVYAMLQRFRELAGQQMSLQQFVDAPDVP